MRDVLSWNISLGRWAGLHVRLHVSFLLLAVALVHLSIRDRNDTWLAAALGGLFLLFFSALAHELGHCLTARALGGSAEQILVWPLGGLAQVNESRDPRMEILVASAGPLVNLSICMLAMPALFLAPQSSGGLLALVNPLQPPTWNAEVSWLYGLQWAFWLNWLLAIVNMLPAMPFDGGRLMRACFWRRMGYAAGVLWTSRAAQVVAVALCVAAAFLHVQYPFAALAMALFGILLFFCARQDADRAHEHESDDSPFGYDFSQGYTSLEKAVAAPRKKSPGPVKKWLRERRATRLLKQQQLEAEEDRRVDEVLVRLHDAGLEGLSSEDRALLNRVSARYRNRHR